MQNNIGQGNELGGHNDRGHDDELRAAEISTNHEICSLPLGSVKGLRALFAIAKALLEILKLAHRTIRLVVELVLKL